MGNEFVEQRDGGYWVNGSRVSLDSVVYAFCEGQTPEAIAQSFPTLSLADVYGAITYYLRHRQEVEDYLAKSRADFEAARLASRRADPAFYQKLADAKRR